MKRKSGFLKALLSITISLTLIATFLPTAFADPDDALTKTSNPSLYQALHDSYGLDPDNNEHITQGEMAGLSGELDLSNKSITDVSGLQYCSGITALNLRSNMGLTSIAPLDNVEMTKLQILNLRSTNVDTIPQTLEMPKLEYLNLSYTPIYDGATDGTTGGLYGITSSNIGSLNTGSNPGLRHLYLEHCTSLTTIENLKDMSSLYELDLLENSLTALPADLSNMDELYTLQLGGSTPSYYGGPMSTPTALGTLANISALATLPRFATHTDGKSGGILNVSNSTLQDASFLNNCNGLEYLYWSYSQETGLVLPTMNDYLFHIQLDHDIHITNDMLRDNIATMERIYIEEDGKNYALLDISGTAITDVSSLAVRTGYDGAKGLGTLYWHDTPSLTPANLATLANLKGLENLHNIDLYGDTGIQDDPATFFNAIKQMTHVTILGLHSCQIGTIEGLGDMTQLLQLYISQNNLTDISELSSLTNLTDLNLYGNYITDITPLQGLSHLTTLDLDENFLDPMAGSADRAILDSLPAAGHHLSYNNQIKVTVNYDHGAHGIAPSPSSQDVYFKQTFTPPVLIPSTGWGFIGWDANNLDTNTNQWDVHSGDSTTVAAHATLKQIGPGATITFTAQYSNAAYTVTFNSNQGSTVAPRSTLYGYTISSPTPPTRNGYTFCGWYTNTSLTTPVAFPYKVTGNVTFYAKWQPNTAYLTKINLSGGYTLAFSKTKTSYKLTIGENVPSITLTPIKENDTAKMWIQGVERSSYTTPVIKNGKYLTVKIKVKLGSKTKYYYVKVTRAKSSVNLLSEMHTNTSEKITPALTDTNVQYTLELGENTKSVRIYGTAKAAGLAKVYYSGKKYTLNNGQYKTATIKVKAQNGSVKKYTIKIHRAPSTNANLKSLKTNSSAYKVQPAFSAGVTTYRVTLPANKSYVIIYASKAESHAKMTINGQNRTSLKVNVPAGSGLAATVHVIVTAQAGGTKDYVINIYRP